MCPSVPIGSGADAVLGSDMAVSAKTMTVVALKRMDLHVKNGGCEEVMLLDYVYGMYKGGCRVSKNRDGVSV